MRIQWAGRGIGNDAGNPFVGVNIKRVVWRGRYAGPNLRQAEK
jgi:hypothetical protein